MLGLCVVGLGIGTEFLEAARFNSRVRVVSVCARRQSSLDDAKRRHSVPFTSQNYRAAIDRPDVDLVVVASPDRWHFEQAAFALACGKHVLCEKPVGVTVDEAVRLAEIAEETGCVLLPGHSYRFIPQFEKLRELAAQGAVGEVFFGSATYTQDLSEIVARGDSWRLSDPQDMLLGAGVHLFDLLCWCLGPVGEVHGYGNNRLPFYPANENYSVSLQFRNGGIGQVAVVLGSRQPRKFVVTMSIWGNSGSLAADNDECSVDVDRGASDHTRVRATLDRSNEFARELDHFLACVHQETSPRVRVREAAHAVAVAKCAARSIAEKRPIAVDVQPD